MKKKYVKPEVVYEEFEMAQSIAGGCDVIEYAQSGHPDDCVLVGLEDNVSYFNQTTNTSCTKDDSELLGVCYNNPDGAIHVFAS